MSVVLNPITVGSTDWGDTVNNYWSDITNAFNGSSSIDALNIEVASSSSTGLKIKAAASQSANLLQIKDSSDTIKTHADQNGQLFIHGASSEPSDGAFNNSQWSMWLDESSNEFNLKAKKSNGSVIEQTVGSSSETIDYIVIMDRKSSGTDGGTFTQGAWRVRDLNYQQADTGNHASITGDNQIRLQAGTYRCYIRCPAFEVDHHKTRLYNDTNNQVLLYGSTGYSHDSSDCQNASVIIGEFTITGQKDLEVQHQCSDTRNGIGFGNAAGFSQYEIYTIVELWKVG